MMTTIDPLPEWVPKYLAVLQDTGLTYTAAAAAGTTVRKVNKLREESAEFDYAVMDAEQIANDILEAEARRRAVDGVEKGVFYKGVLMDTERVYSDSLLTTLLKAKRADEFAERKQISGAGGGPITVLVKSFGAAPAQQVDPLPVIDAEFTPLPAADDPVLAAILDMV